MAIEALQQQEEYVTKMDEVRRAYDNISKAESCDEQSVHLRAYREGYDNGYSDGAFFARHKGEIKETCNAVSREAVRKGMLKYGFHAPDMTVAEFVEDELPPVPARPKGKWIFEDGACPVYRCSNCHKFIPVKMKEEKFEDLSRLDAYIICPRCGADMRGGE